MKLLILQLMFQCGCPSPNLLPVAAVTEAEYMTGKLRVKS